MPCLQGGLQQHSNGSRWAVQSVSENIMSGDRKLPDTPSRLALSPLKYIQKKIPLGSEILEITVRSEILRITVGAPLKACSPPPLTRLSIYVYAREVVLLNVCHPFLCLLQDYSQAHYSAVGHFSS